MAGVPGDIEKGEQRRRIDTRGDLADTASDLVFNIIKTGIGRSRQEACFNCSRAYHFIKRKLLSRKEHHTVDFRRSQMDIDASGFTGIVVLCGDSPEQISVEECFQHAGNDLRPDGFKRYSYFPLRRLFPAPLGIVRIKTAAGLFWEDGVGTVGREGSIDCIIADFFTECFKVGLSADFFRKQALGKKQLTAVGGDGIMPVPAGEKDRLSRLLCCRIRYFGCDRSGLCFPADDSAG